jgi:hypothetical protein
VKRLLCLLSLTVLMGCSSVGDYQPYIVDVTDPVALSRDKAECLGFAKAYKYPWDLTALANKTVQGATSNAAEAVINPLIPAAGAAGAAGTSILQSLGLNSQAQVRIYLLCLSHRGTKSGLYNVVDPNL